MVPVAHAGAHASVGCAAAPPVCAERRERHRQNYMHVTIHTAQVRCAVLCGVVCYDVMCCAALCFVMLCMRSSSVDGQMALLAHHPFFRFFLPALRTWADTFISELNLHSCAVCLISLFDLFPHRSDLGRHLHQRAERHARGGGAAHQKHPARGELSWVAGVAEWRCCWCGSPSSNLFTSTITLCPPQLHTSQTLLMPHDFAPHNFTPAPLHPFTAGPGGRSWLLQALPPAPAGFPLPPI